MVSFRTDWLSEYVLYAHQLLEDGLLEEIVTKLLIYRQGGYTAIDGFLLLLAYFCSGKHEGLKGFDEDTASYRAQLAAIGGRRRFPTQASMSRLLSAVRSDLLDAFGPWLLA